MSNATMPVSNVTDTRRNILLLIPTLHGGGSERVVLNLMRHLDRDKFRITLAVVDMHGAAYRDDVPADVELIDLRCSRVRYALPKLICLIWKRRPDVVLATLGHLNLALSLIRPLLPNRTRYIARESSIVSESLRHYPFRGLWHWAYRRLYRCFDAVICQSRYMRDDLVENFALPGERVTVIHNPLEVARIRKLSAETVDTGIARTAGNGSSIINLVAAGRLCHVKGFDVLIDAIARLADARFRLTILGDGPLRNELEGRVAERGVGWQIRFAGFQKNPFPFFAQADAFVLSSRFEGFPNVVLEALACGTPVVATPAPGGVREILQGMDGCVIAAGMDGASLAAALSKIEPGRRLAADIVNSYEASLIARQYEQQLTGAGAA